MGAVQRSPGIYRSADKKNRKTLAISPLMNSARLVIVSNEVDKFAQHFRKEEGRKGWDNDEEIRENVINRIDLSQDRYD